MKTNHVNSYLVEFSHITDIKNDNEIRTKNIIVGRLILTAETEEDLKLQIYELRNLIEKNYDDYIFAEYTEI